MKDYKKIITDCISGKADAQKELYDIFSPKMYGICLRYAKDYMEAEDFLQEGFIKVFENIRKFRQEGSLEGWIRRIMINVALNNLRKKGKTYPVEDITNFEMADKLDDVSTNMFSNEELMDLIHLLPTRYKMVFNLYVFEGFSHLEISKELGIAVGTSKSNLARARIFLRKKVNERFGDMKHKKVRDHG